MDTVPQTSKDQWALLAGMRFILAYGVFASHLTASEAIFGRWTLALYQWGSYAAVPLFFVISGYSIAASLDREQVGYYERRIRRIYPVALFAIVLACVPYLFIHGAFPESQSGKQYEAPTLAQFLSCVTMTHAIWGGAMDSNTPLWTLGIEWLYYLVAPFVVRVRSRYILGACAVSAVMFWIATHTDPYAVSLEIAGREVPFFGIIKFVWVWFLGFLLYRHRQSSVPLRLSLFAPIYVVLSYSGYNSERCMPTYILLLGLILLYPQIVKLPEMARKALNWLGDVSYPLYAVHYPIILILDWFCHARQEWQFHAGALVAATAVYYLVDKPLRLPRSSVRRERIALDRSLSEQARRALLLPRRRLQDKGIASTANRSPS